jgi:fatty acid desaturase
LNKASSIDRKTRKRRTLEKIGASVVSITLLALIWASLLFGLDTRCYIILTVLLFIIFFIL